VGRIDENKGCRELFELFERYLSHSYGALSLVLVGQSLLSIPDHPRIRHLGFLDDRDKFDAMAASDVLLVPSYFESLSMVTLEAWALGRPVLVNGRCDVLKGQCIRSAAGLYYESAPEFLAALQSLEKSRRFRAALGANGRQFFHRHYAWQVIERKYLNLLEQLAQESAGAPIDPIPGWFARHRRTLPAAVDVVARLPRGAAMDRTGSHGRVTMGDAS
jgi:glycosyltransferase involved in cell wall biosynthesis